MLLKCLIACLVVFACGCRSYTPTTPREYLEGDNAANYQRVFREAAPADVTVVNSVVVSYSTRPGVVTTDDFEFELIASPDQVSRWKNDLLPNTVDIQRRQARPIRPWYAPKPIEAYRSYRDRTSVGYLHLLEETTPEADGRIRVFLSKH